MSKDYPNRADWLAKRCTPRGQKHYGRVLVAVRAGGATKDPGRTHAQRRRKGPLLVATGPGSVNAESEMRRLVMDGEFEKAAEFYEACFRIHYKHGKPKMHWGNVWYANYKRGIAA